MQRMETLESDDSSPSNVRRDSPASLQWLLAASLFCAMVLWMCWGVLAVLMLQGGYPHSPTELFSLIAVAGLSGGSLRISMGFLMPAQRDVTFFSLGIALLIIPVVACGFFLRMDTPLWVLQLLALVSGVGGGCSSAFIGAIHSLLPRTGRATALGLGAGLGNLGAVGALILLPPAVTVSLWGLGGEGVTADSTASTWLGRLPSETTLWLPSAGYIGLLLLLLVILLLQVLLFALRNSAHTLADSGFRLPGRMSLAWGVGLSAGALGIWLISPAGVHGVNLQLSRELTVGLVMFTTLMLLRLLSGSLGRNLNQPYAIFNNKHTWLMGVFSAASLGSFLGFSAGLPLTLHLVFGYSHPAAGVHELNINSPGIFIYVWMGPFIGVLMHPVGGWMAERFGGARITQMCILIMAFSSAGAAYYLFFAYRATEPEQYFLPFLLLLLLLFGAAGAGYASVMRSSSRLFPLGQSIYINVWLSAIAAYGVFYIPSLLAEQLERNTPEQAMIGFAVFYGVCFLLNGWFYLRRDSAFYNP